MLQTIAVMPMMTTPMTAVFAFQLAGCAYHPPDGDQTCLGYLNEGQWFPTDGWIGGIHHVRDLPSGGMLNCRTLRLNRFDRMVRLRHIWVSFASQREMLKP